MNRRKIRTVAWVLATVVLWIGAAPGAEKIDHFEFTDTVWSTETHVLMQPATSDEGDHNGDGTIDMDDVTYLLAYIYSGGPPPPVDTMKTVRQGYVRTYRGHAGVDSDGDTLTYLEVIEYGDVVYRAEARE